MRDVVLGSFLGFVLAAAFLAACGGGAATPATTVGELAQQLAALQVVTGDHEVRISANADRLTVLESPPAPTPSFRATFGTEVSILHGGTVIFNVEHHDDGGGYDHTSGIFTAPRDGVYAFSLRVVVIDDSDFTLTLNGSTDLVRGTSVQGCISLAVSARLLAGDTVQVRMDGGTTDAVGTSNSTPWSQFSGHFVSPQ